jgi:hypothetical protein
VLFFKVRRTKYPVGRKKAPSWKKICFQLEKFFSLTGNPVLGGYWLLQYLFPVFSFCSFNNVGKRLSKKILQKIARPMTKYCQGQDNALS